MLRRSHALALSLSFLLAGLTSGCLSSNAKPEDSGPRNYTARVTDSENYSVGLIISKLDASLRQWSALAATGDKDKDGRRGLAIKEELRHRSRKYYWTLVEQLETGPVRNRMVCAMALGFSNNPDALSVLISALDDTDQRVEINALIGISVLASEDTPLSVLTSRMKEHSNPQARAMASSALVYCLQAGAVGENIKDAGRLGLTDSEPIVRMRSALILAEVGDGESIDTLSGLLYDEVPLVRRAARQSLTHLGMTDDHFRGDAARALATALTKADNNADETSLILYLQKLSRINHGDDADEWMSWANQMP